MKELKAICSLDDIIRFYQDMEAEIPSKLKSRVRTQRRFYEVLKQFRAGEQPTREVNRKKLDAYVKRLTKEINEFLEGYLTIGFPPAGVNFWSDFAPISRLLELELLRDLQSYLDTGRSFDSVMLDKIYHINR